MRQAATRKLAGLPDCREATAYRYLLSFNPLEFPDMVEIPERARELLGRPILVNLATTRPDGAPQVNPMWFIWDGEFLWFTHTNYRQKYKNIANEPRVSISILDPENTYGYVEIRGVVDHIDPDPEAKLYQRLSKWYDGTPVTPKDAPQRVAVAVRPTKIYAQ